MRTIKFLALAVALAAVSASANAQGGRRFQHFSGFDELARLEARQAGQFRMRRFAMARAPRLHRFGLLQRGARMRGLARGPQGARGLMGMRVGGGSRMRPMLGGGRMMRARALAGGRRMGLRAGAGAGFGAARAANATPEQNAFREQFRTQRQAVLAKVQAGALTREKARDELRAWVTEHRPKK